MVCGNIGRRAIGSLLAGAILVSGTGGVSALTVVGNIDNANAPGTVAGGGSLGGVFGAVKSFWEAAITDNFTVTVDVSWGGLAGGTLGEHSLVSQTWPGSIFPPYRETRGSIVLDNDSTSWFVDATPFGAAEWASFNQSAANLGGGAMNVGRWFSGAGGDAAGRFDLFSVLLHEVGHALGLSSANRAYQFETWSDNDIDISGSLPFAGAVLATNNTGVLGDADFGSNAHLATANGVEVLMQQSIGAGKRRHASAADILALCQLGAFTGCDIDPPFGEAAAPGSGVRVPEPASGLVAVAGLGMLGLLRRRTRRE